jgi:DNA repair protein RadA/Sms
LVSSLCGVALPGGTVYFGEASLSGSLRSVSQTEARLKEAAKLGFTGAVIASAGSAAAPERGGPMTVDHVDNLAGLVARIAASGSGRTRRSGS